MDLRSSIPDTTAGGPERLEDRLTGVLLGTALGDALGLPAEGLSAAAVARRFGRLDRFRLLGGTGFVSDDTEQSALVAQSLLRGRSQPSASALHFRRALLGWFLRLPWGIGLGTLRSCVRIALGARRSGVRSAGNGAAMRAAVVGAAIDDARTRQAVGRAIAEVTHTDPRAVEGALFVAELAAEAVRAGPDQVRACHDAARAVVRCEPLGRALDEARALAEAGAPTAEAAARLGTSGYVVHTVPFAAYCLLRHGRGAPLGALQEAIGAGGDTDSTGAILGAWLGALHGASGLPQALIERIHDGPFGPTHLRALGAALAHPEPGAEAPRYSAAAALARNLALYPVVLAHGLRRLAPF